MDSQLERYFLIITRFLENKVTFDQFYANFYVMFNEDENATDAEFLILDKIAGALQVYWPDIKPEDETNLCISEKNLRAELSECLERLQSLAGLSASGA